MNACATAAFAGSESLSLTFAIDSGPSNDKLQNLTQLPDGRSASIVYTPGPTFTGTNILAVIFDEFFTVNRDLSRELDGY
jgi:hypothetical protein